MDAAEREMGLLAEMALGARDLHDFEVQWLERLRPSIGFDAACSVWSGTDGKVLHVAALGYEEDSLRARFPTYMGELSREEVLGFSAREPAIDSAVLSRRRREQLTVYRELLFPSGVSGFVTNVWQWRWGAFGFHLARCGRVHPFTGRDVSKLGRVLSCVKLGQALLAAEHLRVASAEPDWWSHDWRLSAREYQTARLVARGFSNPEIGGFLRVSPHTVRNHLATIFRKAGVSSRAELVFAMSSPPARTTRPERSSRPWRVFLAGSEPSTGSPTR
jgi:DNA-binding CsgD family transcriptional regulator